MGVTALPLEANAGA